MESHVTGGSDVSGGSGLDAAFPVRWADGYVELIDQTLLPERYEVIRCRNVDDLAEAIGSLRVRGAPAIGIAAAYGLAAAAHQAALAGALDGEVAVMVSDAAAQLRPVRPTAVNLAWACHRLEAAAHRAASRRKDVAEATLAEARAIEAEDRASCSAMGDHGADLLERLLPRDRGIRLLTHCNTGSLCTGGIGTAFGVARRLFERGRLERLWIDETRPLLQGGRLTAWEALQVGIPHAVLADAAAPALMASGLVDAVLVGADRVAANGDTANKIGTYGLAVAAAHHGVPFVVVAPTSSLDLSTPGGDQILVELRAAEEIRLARGQVPLTPATSPVHNPAFDVTPAPLVTALVTERGVVERPDRDRVLAALDRNG